VLAPGMGIDEELHFATVSRIGGTYLMLFESDRLRRETPYTATEGGGESKRAQVPAGSPKTPLVATGGKGTWEENLLVTTTSALQRVGDEIHIYYIGCPNVYNSWPVEYAVSPARRGSQFAPTYLGVAILGRDRFGYARGPGVLTTHPWAVEHDEEIALNADGDDVSIRVLPSRARPWLEAAW